MTFEDWLKTDTGKRYNDPSFWRDGQPYHQNKLYHIYEAGVASGDHDERLYKTLQYYNETVKKLRLKITALKKEIKAIKSLKS